MPPRPDRSIRWPFWLLLAAWVCANSPQPAVYAVLGWLAEAGKFSHQQQLSIEVAHLLVGEKPPPRTIENAMTEPPVEPPPVVPADAVWKQLPLALEHTLGVFAPSIRILGALNEADFSSTRRDPPLLGPPRADG